MHVSLNFTKEQAELLTAGNKTFQKLNFLDVSVILNDDNTVETDIFYKPTNSHDYLNFYSHHPEHIKHDIPYN